MTHKSELEKAIEYAVGGTPQIKPDEKRKWLGEFRERVVLGISLQDAYKIEAEVYVREAMKDKSAYILILNQKLPMDIVSSYMKIAKEAEKEIKVLSSDSDTAMGIVVASNGAIDKESVEIEIQELPEKFKKANAICSICMDEVSRDFPRFSDRFKKQSVLDKLFGTKCSACKK